LPLVPLSKPVHEKIKIYLQQYLADESA
jgi:hypothetical protein